MDRLYRDNLALRFSLDDWMVDVSLGGDSPQRLMFQGGGSDPHGSPAQPFHSEQGLSQNTWINPVGERNVSPRSVAIRSYVCPCWSLRNR